MIFENYLINTDDMIEVRQIGEGNFGSVSLVYNKNNKKFKIAAKKIPVDLKDPDVQKYFIREVSIMLNLDHPNLIEFVGFSIPSSKDQNFTIYSKYLPNNNLLEVIKKDELKTFNNKILNPTRLSIIVYGIVSAMAYLHRNNIVHRDLKPENVFLDENYKPVLADFGLSKIYNEDITKTSRLGTPYYMAPELFVEEDENNDITYKIDVYAFAVTIYSLFTTKYQFKGPQPRSINQLMNAIIKGKRYQIPNYVPDFYVNLIQRCWSNNPKERPSFKDLLKEFDENDDFMFYGANKKEVHEYMKSTKSYNSSSNKNDDYSSEYQSESEEYEDTEEFDFNCL